jgi:Coiled-coil domain-containing protein 90-like
MAVLFDTLKLADRLEAAGMPPEQAKGTAAALAEGLTDTVATAADIETVRSEIRESELRLRGEIAALRADITALRGDMQTGDERLHGEIKGLQSRLVWWIIGTGVGATFTIIGVVTALFRLLH